MSIFVHLDLGVDSIKSRTVAIGGGLVAPFAGADTCSANVVDQKRSEKTQSVQFGMLFTFGTVH